ncbi:MAG: hypothetical protein FJZ90_05260 [Chloroflexi bacterium]|nr:hypothetical protein [Chloroflexota bacterium]
MTARQSTRAIALVLCLLWSVIPHAALADESDPLVIESQVTTSAELFPSSSPYSLFVQATSWTGRWHVYVLTVLNSTPWPLSSLYIVDRYFPDDPEAEEVVHDWLVERLEPGRASTLAIKLPDEPFRSPCHQIEISLADGLGTILMDCNGLSSTTIWDVPLSEEMATFLALPSLTTEEPTGPSKLGIHVTRNSSPAIMAFVRDATPAVVAAVGDLGWLAEVKEASPNTVTIGRLIEGDQSFEGDPAERARQFVNANAETYKANPGVDYWLGWNEPVFRDEWEVEWYAAYEAERTVAMAELGLKVAIGNFSAGTPEATQFAKFLPAIAVAKQYGGILAVHEYSAPTMRHGVGAGIPGLENRHDFGALTLRYRFWYGFYLQPNDLVVPLVVTEAGIDGGVLRDGEDRPMGWRDFTVSRDRREGTPAQPLESYLEQLSWYDDELRRDSYALGFAIFNVGDSGGQWASFDLTDYLPQLGELAKAKDQAE